MRKALFYSFGVGILEKFPLHTIHENKPGFSNCVRQSGNVLYCVEQNAVLCCPRAAGGRSASARVVSRGPPERRCLQHMAQLRLLSVPAGPAALITGDQDDPLVHICNYSFLESYCICFI